MPHSSLKHARGSRHALFCLILAACLGASGQDAPATFSGNLGGERVNLSADVHDVGGVAYVSLNRLVDQLGGGMKLMTGQGEISLDGASAVAVVNDAAVRTATKQFYLQHPVLAGDNALFIAASDAEAFFREGFGVAMTRTAAAAPPVELSPSTPADALLEEDPAALLAPLPDPAPAPAAVEPLTPVEPALTEEAPPLEAAAPPESAGETPDTATVAPESLRGPVLALALDAGHGGADAGTTAQDGVLEKEVTLALAQRVAEKFKERSKIPVSLTRDGDRAMTAGERAASGGVKPGALLVSLHAGAPAAPEGAGVLLLHAPVTGRGGDPDALAGRAQSFAEGLAGKLNGAEGGAKAAVRAAPLRLQTAAGVPCVLAECGTLSTAEGAAALADAARRDALADGIAAALAELLNEHNARP